MNRKAFTLIELLAVIIILGILMLVAIPSVTSYINNSRKETYVSTIKELIRGASNLVNDGSLDIYDKDITYYIPASAIKLENGKAQSPYGEIDDAYVVVTYNGEKHEYYYVGKDQADVGVKNLKREDLLKNDSIETDVDEVSTDIGIDKRHKIVVYNDDREIKEEKDATDRVDGKTGEKKTFLCKRAKTLHTEECSQSEGVRCYNDGFSPEGAMGTATITYGQLGTSGEINTGDAFDCDVNSDGIYNSTTERFYYVSDYYNGYTDSFDSDKAVFIYSRLDQSSYYSGKWDIDSLGGSEYWRGVDTYHGPVSITRFLPDSTTWSNKKIIPPGVRQIRNQNGGIILKDTTTQNQKEYTLEPFDYGDRVARPITYQEILNGCGDGISNNRGFLLNKCVFLYDGTTYRFTSSPSSDWSITETPFDKSIADIYTIRYTYGSLSPTACDSDIDLKFVIDAYYDDIDY